ncbi:MAG TPA: DUF4185 domain-containing protein, partial [Candidatus Angelobacter sp.]|nr:DUF4185 domain-containing protein [Candidatus Angelobacter sp.]
MRLRNLFFCSAIFFIAAARAVAQNGLTLTWITNSSVKMEQVIGDKDWADAARGTNTPTTSLTVTRFHVLGNGLGYSFEHDGKLIFLFGDTISEDPTNLNYHAADPIAWSTSTDPEAGLLINFYTNSDGSPLFVKPSGIKMGPDDVPNSGFSLNDRIYLICHTGSDTSNTNNSHQGDYSVLVSFDEAGQTFTTNRTISMLDSNLDSRSMMQGHFIIDSPHIYGTNVIMFGLGEYRATDIYLSIVPTNSFLSGAGTRYFAGLTNGQPLWNNFESNAAPVVVDNPTNGPPWPNDFPTIGNVSVIYSADLGLW